MATPCKGPRDQLTNVNRGTTTSSGRQFQTTFTSAPTEIALMGTSMILVIRRMLGASERVTSAGTGGVQSAANTLSEYYINRAEQYQPVISLNGGTKVELVFMEGISLQ